MSDFTKGEWILEYAPPSNGWNIWDNGEGTAMRQIAFVSNYRRSKKVAAADARLIAYAPILLDDLEDAYSALEKDLEGNKDILRHLARTIKAVKGL
jgi:hypothetical protein